MSELSGRVPSRTSMDVMLRVSLWHHGRFDALETTSHGALWIWFLSPPQHQWGIVLLKVKLPSPHGFNLGILWEWGQRPVIAKTLTHLGGGLKDCLEFSPRKLGKMFPILTHIFQMGWFNHPLTHYLNPFLQPHGYDTLGVGGLPWCQHDKFPNL